MRRSWYVIVGVAAVALAALTGNAQDAYDAALHAGKRVWQVAGATEKAPVVVAVAEVEQKFLADEFTDRIATETFWRNNRSNRPAAVDNNKGRSRLQGPQPDASWFIAPPTKSWDADPSRSKSAPRTVTGYRTVCVRMCDGFFFPISFGTSEGSFSRDQATCTNSCPGARLYHYKASSEDPEDMVDSSSGQAYSRLPNANLFRTQFVESCKCKPHPWEQEATSRHRIYALEDQRRKGNRAVVAELDDLKAKKLQETYGTNSRRRPGDRNNRRRLPAGEDQTNAGEMATVASVSAAPRSDANRGQGSSDRPWSSTGATTTGSIPATTQIGAPQVAAAGGSRSNVAGDALNSPPSLSPIARAATAAAAVPTEAVAGSIESLETASAAPDPVMALTTLQALQAEVQPQPGLQPEPLIAVPFEQEGRAAVPAPDQPRRARRGEKRGRATAASARPSDMMRLGAGSPRAGGPRPVWASGRSTDWTRNVFSQ